MGEVGAELWLHWRRRVCASSRRPHARSARRSRRRFTNVWRIHTAREANARRWTIAETSVLIAALKRQ